MKKIITITLACALALAFAGCNNPHRSPKAVERAFVESFYAGNFEQVKQYVTPESYPYVEYFKHSFPPECFEKTPEFKVGTIEVKETSDTTALCSCEIIFNNNKKFVEKTSLLKRDRKWYISMKHPGQVQPQ